MATYEQSTEVHAEADALVAHLSDIGNLPKYFGRMTSASPAEGEAVHTTANVEGQEVEGKARFRVNGGELKIEWGSEGPNNYSSELNVTSEGGSSGVSVRIATESVETSWIDDSLIQTLANIKRLVEAA